MQLLNWVMNSLLISAREADSSSKYQQPFVKAFFPRPHFLKMLSYKKHGYMMIIPYFDYADQLSVILGYNCEMICMNKQFEADEHRIVCKASADSILIAQLRYHY
jgi:hypothetical protein